MSDLSAANCGCGCDTPVGRCGNDGGLFGGNNCIWIILLLVCCGGCGNGRSGGFGCGGNDSCLWIILLLVFCGGLGDGCDCC